MSNNTLRSNSINFEKLLSFDNIFNIENRRNYHSTKYISKVTSFKKHWIDIVAACGPMSIDLDVKETDIPYHMVRMINMLISEDRNLPNNLANCGECMEYFLNKECLHQLVDSSIKKIPPHGLIYVTIDFYSNLCSLMNENFLTKKDVYEPLLTLLKYCSTQKDITSEYESFIIDLLFNICQKISIHPQILNIFIYEDGDYYECILFEYLKQFIFSHGKTGEMARTSMKYLFEHPFEVFSNYIIFTKFPEQLVDNLCMIFNELPLKLDEINQNNKSINQFTTLFSLIENIIMCCSMQAIRNSIMFNINDKFLKLIINKYKEFYNTSENLEAISIYLYYMLSKIHCIDFSSCFVSFIFEKFKFDLFDKETNLFNLIMDNIMTNERNTSLATVNMLIISCLLKQHYRYTISYLIPNIRTRVNNSKNSENESYSDSITFINSNSEETLSDDEINNSIKEIENEIKEVKENLPNEKCKSIRDEVNRYIELYNSAKTDFGNEITDINNKCNEYILDINTNLNIQLKGLNFNNLNKDYPENIIQEILEEPNQIKAIKLLDQEKIFSQLFTLLKSFFNNSPDFNLALTDTISQLLSAPEIYLFIYLVDRDILDDDKKDSLYTILISLIEQRKELLNNYGEKLLEINSLDDESIYQEQQQIIISDFNRNSRYMLEFIKEVTVSIFENY
ncbi:hypothetical protein H8356DRAFT_1290882 [Neocallimastix lanati (nom. inval.)]|nr:hypothetical protein H8356DRAFT_1290882 [Neocallimastix sp. JGI-2020a]